MKSFRRHCGEGITTPVGMWGMGMEGERKTRMDDEEQEEGWERPEEGHK